MTRTRLDLFVMISHKEQVHGLFCFPLPYLAQKTEPFNITQELTTKSLGQRLSREEMQFWPPERDRFLYPYNLRCLFTLHGELTNLV